MPRASAQVLAPPPPASPAPSRQQLMTQKAVPRNDCLPGLEVSHHPDNRVDPSEHHQCTQQSQGLGVTPPRDLSVEAICCGPNSVSGLHDSGSCPGLVTSDTPSPSPSLAVKARVPLLRCVSGAIDVPRGVNNCRCDVVKTLVFVKRPRVFKAASQSERGAVTAADAHNWRPTRAETRVKCHSTNFIRAPDQG